ncbi:MAG: hypothetical protein H6872_03150 [Methylobacteriaceae bacterium]|nr:hypothetical protein [Methylobacteriaceae bacterium]
MNISEIIRVIALGVIPTPADQLGFALWLHALREDIRSDPSMSEEERELLDRTFASFRDQLATIDAHGSDVVKAAAAQAIYDAMWIGLMASVSSQTTTRMARALNQRKTTEARDARSTRAKQLEQAVLDHIEAKGLTPERTLGFAAMIRPDVRELLGLPREGDDWPSAPTIKKKVP